MCTFSPWALLPPIYSLCTAAGLWLVYFIAVGDEKITPLGSQYRKGRGSLYPYISMAGNSPPASCVFSEVMNLSAFGGLVIVVLRYLQLRPRINKPWLNVVSLVLFSVACFGMTLVGNFQFFAQETIHNVGACLTFGLGTLFCWVQSYVTLSVNLMNEGRPAAVARFLLSGFITVCVVLYFSLMSKGLHMHAARCQWVLVMFFLAFICSFATEFRHYRFHVQCTENHRRPVSTSGSVSEAFRSEQTL